MAKTSFHNGDAVVFVPGHHGRPHLPVHVQMMVLAPLAGMTGHVVDTYHDAAQVRWDDGATTVVHALDLNRMHGTRMLHNPAFHEYGRESARKGENRHWREGTNVTFTPRGWIEGFYSTQHLNALPPPYAPGRVVSVMAGGRHSTTAGRDDSWVYVEWPNGAIVPVAREDLTRR